jgi:hypothetical protein
VNYTILHFRRDVGVFGTPIDDSEMPHEAQP